MSWIGGDIWRKRFELKIINMNESDLDKDIINPLQSSSTLNAEEKYLTVLKNRNSGKYFIFIEDDYSNKNKALLAHPNGKVISYSLDIFEEPEEMEADYLLKHGLVEQIQYEQFKIKIKEIECLPGNLPDKKKKTLIKNVSAKGTKKSGNDELTTGRNQTTVIIRRKKIV